MIQAFHHYNGACLESSHCSSDLEIRQYCLAASVSGHDGKGLASRRLRLRSKRTASRFEASAAWKAPRPFTATMAPDFKTSITWL